MQQRGADVRVVDYPSLLVSAEAPDEQQWDQAMQLLVDAIAEAVRGSTRVTLLAKSLGTRVIARLPESLLPRSTDAVWLTPIFADAAIATSAATKAWRSLYVYGSADPACDDDALRGVVAATGGSVLRIDGADHGLEVAGDAEASAHALVRLTAEMLTWTA